MMIYEIREFALYHDIKDHIFNNSWLIYSSYFFFIWSGLILIIYLFIDGGFRVTNIQAINVLYLGILLISIDTKEHVSFIKFFEWIEEKFPRLCCSKKTHKSEIGGNNNLKDVRAEYINEADAIFRKYIEKRQPEGWEQMLPHKRQEAIKLQMSKAKHMNY